MTRGEFGLRVLPRELAASVTVSAITRAVWATAAAVLLLSVPGVVEFAVGEGRPRAAWLPVAALLVMIAALGILARRPSTATIFGYLLVGAVCLYVYEVSLFGPANGQAAHALYLVNRPALALVLVGTSSASPLRALGWGVIGYATAEAVLLAASARLGMPVVAGAGPTIVLVNYSVVFLGIALIQRAQRGRVPDVDRLLEETHRLDAQRKTEQRAIALIHDTVLSDLALVINGPAHLDDRVRARLRKDVTTLARADWDDEPERADDLHSRDAEFRNQLMTVASDFQWKGLTVDVSVDANAVLALSHGARIAALGAVRACLENVLNHAGVSSAELILGGNDTMVTMMVVDSGVGFDRDEVAVDRLGLRSSVVGRVESAGGTVRIWSTPGSGTSILITLPLSSAAPLGRAEANA